MDVKLIDLFRIGIVMCLAGLMAYKHPHLIDMQRKPFIFQRRDLNMCWERADIYTTLIQYWIIYGWYSDSLYVYLFVCAKEVTMPMCSEIRYAYTRHAARQDKQVALLEKIIIGSATSKLFWGK